MKVILTEKPSVAKEIARVLHISLGKGSLIEGDGYAITWAFGHLIELCPPEEYGWSDWNAGSLPMIPESFKLRPVTKWNPDTGSMQNDKGVLKQLAVIKELFNRAEEIIVATDAGREGELIFRYIYEYLHCEKPFKRLWISSLTYKAISDGLNHLHRGEAFDNLYYSAKCRSESDWLVGMNASRALTVGAAFKSKFSLGRVQTPTLAMICTRYLENKHFISEPYYHVSISLEKEDVRFKAKSEKYADKETAEEIFRKITNVKEVIVTDIQKKDTTKNPPLLYDLTSLQRDANKQFDFSASDTLKLAQSLYEKKYISYPRTSSRYISDDVFETIPGLLKTASLNKNYGELAANLLNQPLNPQSVNHNKVTDHHALLITEQPPENLGEKESLVYELILSRMIESFSTPCQKSMTTILIDCAGQKFSAGGSTILNGHEGWRIVKRIKETSQDKEEEKQILPGLSPFETLIKTGEELLSNMTKPKALHTDATLLTAMETCGKEIEDEAIREALKESGIGTPATRANIMETLITRNYVERIRKTLSPTPKGLAVYSLLKDKQISSPELTGQWEARLEKINKGRESPSLFMKDIIQFTRLLTVDILNMGCKISAPDLKTSGKEIILCPKCKNGELRKGKKNYYCSNWKSGCGFVLWDAIAGKKLTERQIRQLAKDSKTDLIKGFKNKSGKEFNARIILDDELKTEFQFTGI